MFKPFNLFTIAQKQIFTFPRFEDGCHFQDGCHEATSCVFLFPFLDWPFSWTEKKTTQILVFLNIHFGILTWNMGYLWCLCTISAWWPQIVNFISPNYAQSSVFVKIKYIGSLAVSFYVFMFPFLIDLFVAQFCEVCTQAYVWVLLFWFFNRTPFT